ncbi:MAG: right-handed parallel beta-helix repeat-containing protein [Pirellulaceae bacterium]|nr:right-handed parallel beta-helix repeat-containing protein [Pirellulaceae bacterium]
MTPSRSCPFFAFLSMLMTVSAALPLVFGDRAVAAGRDFYVSPGGNDAGLGSESDPFATLARARAAVRDLRLAENPEGPVQVFLRGGMHAIAEKLVFGPEDSGTAESPVTYRSYPGERAVLSGGRRLTGTWRQSPGKPYWQLDIPEVRETRWRFCSLFVDGESRMRSREPNWGHKVLRAEGRAAGEDARQAFRYYAGDFDPAWSNATDIDIVLLQSWTPTIHRIEAIDADQRVVRFHSSHGRDVDFWEKNFRYYLSNVFEALDEPGEWYLNRHTGTLYYYPMPGTDPNSSVFIAPVLKSEMIELAGDLGAERFVEHLHFRDLDIRHVDADLDRYNGMYRQGHMFLTAAVVARGLRSASLVGCTFAQLGEYALELADGCRDVRVERCHIWDIGAGAMQLGVSDLATLLKPPVAADSGSGVAELPPPDGEGAAVQEVLGLVIDNNCIHRLGTVWHGCYGIVNRFASRTRITHNEIFDVHWDAIGLDARWNWKGEKYSHGNVVAYNHLHHLGLRYHTDAAGIYQFGPLDTHIHHNRIHDNVAYPNICGFAGIYLDEQSRGAVVENNLVYRVDWYAYFQHKGVDNVFRNNVGAFARDGLIRRGGLSDVWKANHMEAYRNLYVTDNEIALRHDWVPGDRPPVLRQNMYHTLAPDTELTFAGKTLAEWQAAGQDEGSVVGDPGFADPARDDFSLRPDSPAVSAVGFQPFDHELCKAGLYGEPEWRSIGEQYPRRQPSATWTPEDLARLVAFETNFEDMPVGYQPDIFRLSTSGEGTFQVTDEAAYTGTKSAKCSDRKGLAKSFYPLMQLTTRGLSDGPVTLSFAVMLPAASPAPLIVEFRGAGGTSEVGPLMRFLADGRILADGKQVLMAPPGSWTQVEIHFRLGEVAPRTYRLTLRHDGATIHNTLPFRHDTFREFRWLGFIASDDTDGAFYLDDMKLTFEE